MTVALMPPGVVAGECSVTTTKDVEVTGSPEVTVDHVVVVVTGVAAGGGG
jgi:hypothetical protein